MCVSCFGCWLHGYGLRILIKSYYEVKWKWKWSCSVMSDFLWPMDCSPPGSSIHGIFQARILEWVAIYFSRGSSRPRDETRVSHIAGRHFNVWATREALMCNFYPAWVLSHFACVRLLVTPWTFACQAPLSMGFSRQEYWRGLPCPPPGGSFWLRDQTHISYVSCIGRQVLYWSHLGSPTFRLVYSAAVV